MQKELQSETKWPGLIEQCKACTAQVKFENPIRDLACTFEDCDENEKLWLCLICGSIGCGRYSKKHSLEHSDETDHQLVMELSSSRIWSYKGDNFVHRILRANMDGGIHDSSQAELLAAYEER
jgi:BRCA1-associated protein